MIADISLFIVLINLHGNATLARAPPSSPHLRAIYCLDRTCNFFHSPLRIPRSSSFSRLFVIPSLLLLLLLFRMVNIAKTSPRYRNCTIYIYLVCVSFFLSFSFFSSRAKRKCESNNKMYEWRVDAYFAPRRFFLLPREDPVKS